FGTRFSMTVFRYGGFGDGGAAGVKKKTVASVDLVASAMVTVMTVVEKKSLPTISKAVAMPVHRLKWECDLGVDEEMVVAGIVLLQNGYGTMSVGGCAMEFWEWK
ncbi:hypothetical protein A2U01_0030667, partial [Trifolium medium]|nr:hypothetical protein [Trifolium medium]